jgi:hypothetical protein
MRLNAALILLITQLLESQLLVQLLQPSLSYDG